MQTQAPYQYIRDYYRQAQAKYERFPEIAEFYRAALRQVRGDSVLDVGCGPLLYDDMRNLARPPSDFVGVDINENSFTFMRRSRDPRLLRAKAYARACGSEVETICGDVIECADALRGRFDSVLGVGFFATFFGPRLEPLLQVMRQSLRPRGRLVKLTWHGPHRTLSETRKKLAYRYDNVEQPSPETLVGTIERAGFVLKHQSILQCDPGSYGWDAIQACAFEKL